jgi:two-component system KDP operon response regulator KdpE
MLVLVADDDRAVREALERALQLAGYDVELASDGDAALAAISQRTPDAVVLDVMMPGYDGLDVTRRLRREGNRVPVLLLTARDAVGDRVEGLDAGADDYLTKPFGVGELLARVRAALRRQNALSTAGTALFQFGDVEVDQANRIVHKAGAIVHLTPIEYRLLTLLIANAGKVLTHRHLLREVWGPSFVESNHYVRIYVAHLRQKLEADPAQPRHIVTETGVGYRFQIQP